MKHYFFLVHFFLLTSLLFATENPVLIVAGTRPEAIKIMPVYTALKQANIPVILCNSGQHKELSHEIFNLFNITPDYDFDIMKPSQDLVYITASVLEKTTDLIKEIHPSLVCVQGDTTTGMAAALAAFYSKIPVAHIEAGLRTYNLAAPFPEELNRQLISKIATFHFSPTSLSTNQLLQEGISSENIYQTGNTVVDALFYIRNKIQHGEISPSKPIQELIARLKSERKKVYLLTAHRRESLGQGLESIFSCLYKYLLQHQEIAVIYPVHPNPAIKETITKIKLDALPNLILSSSLPYTDLVYLLLESDAVLTDSGGIQEEAVSLNKHTLVLRNETDRPEGLVEGIAKLVGTNPLLIEQALNDIAISQDIISSHSPFGDGQASQRICSIIENYLRSLK